VELYILSPYAFAACLVKRSLHTLTKRAQLETNRTHSAERIFGPKRKDVLRKFWKFNSDVLYDLHSSPNIIGFIKSRNLRWMGREAHRGVMKN